MVAWNKRHEGSGFGFACRAEPFELLGLAGSVLRLHLNMLWWPSHARAGKSLACAAKNTTRIV